MADNYLERKMEDMRSGRIRRENVAAARKSASPVAVRTRLSLVYPDLRVFVTGGAKGIGRGVVEAFRAIDVRVAFCDVDTRAGNQLAQSSGARFYPADASSPEALEGVLDDLASRWGDIDVIVNNVGIGCFSPLADTSLEEWDHVIDLNLRSVFVTGRYMSRLRARTGLKGGSVINIASTRARQSEADTGAYSASKGGVVALTHSLMMSLAPYGITVNCISPGWINVSGEDISDEDKAQHPSGRVGVPEDIASLAVYLAHPSHNFINGADIPVDGGMTRKMIYLP